MGDRLTPDVVRLIIKGYREEIIACLAEDGEWTTPRGNGVNSAEAIEVIDAVWDIVKRLS